MNIAYKITLTVLFLLGDIGRIMMIGKQRDVLTPGDCAMGVGISLILIVLIWCVI